MTTRHTQICKAVNNALQVAHLNPGPELTQHMLKKHQTLTGAWSLQRAVTARAELPHIDAAPGDI